MGKYSDAVSQGRQRAVDEKKAQDAARKAKKVAQKAEFETGNNWLARVVQPRVAAANEDLRDEKWAIQWVPSASAQHPSVSLNFRKVDTPRGRQIGSIGMTVLPGGRIKVFYDGGLGHELGTINDVNSDQIDELLVNFLRELSRELTAKSS
jgi:hypothetical protein